MSNSYKFAPEYAQSLLKLAAADLDSASMHLRGHSRPEHVCFYARQCVEGTLRAVLVVRGVALPTLYDIRLLMGMLPPTVELPPHRDALAFLEAYSVMSSAAALRQASLDEAKVAWQHAQDVFNWARVIVAEPSRAEPSRAEPSRAEPRRLRHERRLSPALAACA
jgi:HEPN domain-containing protein